MGKSTALASAIIFLVVISIGLFVIYHKDSTPLVASTFVLSPSPLPPSPTKAPEPFVGSWTTYKNDTYSFTINVPSGWNQQEFTPENGGLIVAFSPNPLPCKTCTYVHDGYYSVHVFNQSTDPQSYASFTTQMQSIGKAQGYIPIQLDGVNGVLFDNTVSVQDHDFVYEVALDTDDGNDKALSSDLFQKAASSLQFTYLIFSN